VDAPPAASAALCRAICYPRLALKCAALREAVAFMGHSGGEGEEVRDTWVGVDPGQQGIILAMASGRPCDAHSCDRLCEVVSPLERVPAAAFWAGWPQPIL